MFNNYFLTEDQLLIKNIKDFYEKIDFMSEEAFKNHQEREDFSKWLKDIFHEEKLAGLIKNKNKKKVKIILKEFLEKNNLNNSIDSFENKNIKNKESFLNNPSNFNNDINTIKQDLDKNSNFFEKKNQELKNLLQDEIPDDIQEAVNNFNKRYEELKDLLSQKRKEEYDVFIAEQLIKLIKPKIEYLKVSHNTEIIKSLEDLFNNLEYEINNSKKKINIKKELGFV